MNVDIVSNRIRSPYAMVAVFCLLAIAIALMFYQYARVRQSFFDDTFIYLHMAQNAAELGTWRYFPDTLRPALLASSPLHLIALSLATLIAWPITGGARSLESVALVLPLSGVLTALLFLPFWWRDKIRFLLLAIPYFLLAAGLDAVVEFEGGLLYWWLLTLLRDFTQPEWGKKSSLNLALGAFIRPDLAAIAALAYLFALWRRRASARDELVRTAYALGALCVAWVLLASLLGVWPIPVTYWAKAAMPNLFATNSFLEMLSPRLAESAFGSIRRSASTYEAVSILWLMLAAVLAASTKTFSNVRVLLIVGPALLLMSKMPSNFWWYYQNIWVMGIAVSIGALMFWPRGHGGRAVALVLLLLSFWPVLSGRVMRDPTLLWRFDQPSRAQGYAQLAATFDVHGTVDLPGIGRGYIKNPEIGMTAYFGGRHAWVWDTAGLAQAHPGAMRSPLRWFYRGRLHKTPDSDLLQLVRDDASVRLFEVWALEDRQPAAQKPCVSVVFEGAVCLTRIIEHKVR